MSRKSTRPTYDFAMSLPVPDLRTAMESNQSFPRVSETHSNSVTSWPSRQPREHSAQLLPSASQVIDTNVQHKTSHSNPSTRRSHTKDPSNNHALLRQHTAFPRQRPQDVVRAAKAPDGLLPRPDVEQARVRPVQKGDAHGFVLADRQHGDPGWWRYW